MKTIVSIFTLLIMVTAMAKEPVKSAVEKDPTGIEFHQGTWDDALKMARETGKPVFLDVSASWCGPCKALKRNTFPNEQVGDLYNANFINVLVDGEKGEGKELAKKYRVNSYPTMIFLNGDGNIIARTSGYRDPHEFIALGKRVLEE